MNLSQTTFLNSKLFIACIIFLCFHTLYAEPIHNSFSNSTVGHPIIIKNKENGTLIRSISLDSIEQLAYVKASNTNRDDRFGRNIAIDNNTMVVGTYHEDSSSTGINADDTNNNAPDSGAVYVFIKNSEGEWEQQAYIKASNTQTNDYFGIRVAIYGDTLVASATGEDSDATGVNGDQNNDNLIGSGAVYVFTRSDGIWSQQAYIKRSANQANSFGLGAHLSLYANTLAIESKTTDDTGAVYIFTRVDNIWSEQAYLKASNPQFLDYFGVALSLSENKIAIGAVGEASNATGINGDQTDNSKPYSGAVYVFERTGTTWSQQAYIKASNTDEDDFFGRSVSLSGDTLIVGADGESSHAIGINGDETDNSAPDAGAVYAFSFDGTEWSQQAYIKASNAQTGDAFGYSVAFSNDFAIIGAYGEDSKDVKIDGNQDNNDFLGSGAAYLFSLGNGTWKQQHYIKPSNTGTDDHFADGVGLSNSTLIIGSNGEDSFSTGIDGSQNDDSLGRDSGAVYIFGLPDILFQSSFE